MRRFNIWLMLLFIIGSELLGFLGSFATAPNIPTWFKGLVKPPLSPPNWIFAPVWTILFALMGISAYLVFQKRLKNKQVNQAMMWFLAQFSLNILWSFLFFGLRNPLAGLLGIVVLWSTITITMLHFKKISKPACYLLIPYLFWVSFAAYLNASIYLLNH